MSNVVLRNTTRTWEESETKGVFIIFMQLVVMMACFKKQSNEKHPPPTPGKTRTHIPGIHTTCMRGEFVCVRETPFFFFLFPA